MRKFIEKCCDGVVKEWGMIVVLVLLAMPPMLFHPVFFGGLHSGLVNGFDAELWRQLKYPIVDMGLLMLLVIVTVEIVHWIGKGWFKWVVYGVAIVLGTVRICLWFMFKMRITTYSLIILSGTNGRESNEFVQTYLFGLNGLILIGTIIGLVGLCLLLEWINSRIVLGGVWKKISLCLFAGCLIWGFVESRWTIKLLRCNVSNDVVNWQNDVGYSELTYGASTPQALMFSLVSVECINRDVKQCGLTAYEVQNRKSEVLCQNDSLIVVFVLGESYIKSHCQLYGYERETTPHLKNEQDSGRLYVFNDAVAPYTYTSNAVKSIFFTGETGQPWYEFAFFPQLFRMAGFEVDIWSNHNKYPKVAASFISNDLVSILYNEHIKKLAYSHISEAPCGYDEDILDDYIMKSFDMNCNRLLIYHPMGQHVDATDRFPHTEENLVFDGSDAKSKAIAMYDNACVYNDRIICEVIDLVRDKKSVIVYFSDHGDEMYDYRNSFGRKAAEPGMEKEFLKFQAEVPFMIWCSDKYKEAYPEIVHDIERSVDKPLYTSDVCQVFFHLTGLKSPWYKEERDLLSDKYKCGERIVNGEYDYDDVMNRK